jgi:hypothetical protein
MVGLMQRPNFRLPRPSTVLLGLWRAAWIGVALLHFFLFVRRLVSGGWADAAGQVKLLLGLAGAIYGVYGSVRLGHMFRALDRAPRRVVAIALLIFFGHLAVSPRVASALDESAAELAPALIATPILLGAALGLGLILAAARSRRRSIVAPSTPQLAERLMTPKPRFDLGSHRIRPPPFAR